jgi:O-methyltransferase
MVPRSIYIANLELARKHAREFTSVVECGVWYGGMMAGMMAATRRHVYGFDSFQGLPDPKEIDGEAALKYARNKSAPSYFNNCSARYDDVVKVVRSAGSNYTLVQGWYSRQKFRLMTSRISVLRLDCDWYDSVKVCIENLYPLLVPGGVVIVDDYYAYDGAARAINEFIADKHVRIREYKGVCYFLKE